MNSIIIRTARPDDYAHIVSMCKNSMVATYGDFFDRETMKPWVEGNETDTYVETMLSNMIVAEDKGRVVGVISLKEDVIDLIWIAIEYRGKGIGKTLMVEAERILSARGFERAKLECFEPNTNAIAFYKKRGWSIKDTSFDNTAGVNKVIMEKNLQII